MENIKFNTQYFTVILLFLVGAMNSIDYFNFMGLNSLSSILRYTFYLLLVITTTLLMINLTIRKEYISSKFIWYWIIIVFGITFKLMILFIQFPSDMLPGGIHFLFTTNFLIIILLIVVIINSLKDLKFIKMSIWSLGIGLFFSSIIPLMLYPELIGLRQAFVNGYEFSGGFWNSGVIAFLSIGWLLIAISINEKSRVKRTILFIMFFIFALTGLAGLSRALFVSITFSVIVYLAIANKLKQYLKIIVLGLIVLTISFYAFNDIIENMLYRFDGGINVQEEARIDIWKAYLTNISDFFWFGEITGDYHKYTQWIYGPHSAPLNWFVRFGVFGLIGFFMLLLGLIKSIRIINKSHPQLTKAALYAWLIAFISISFINETGFNDLSLLSSIAIVYAWGINSFSKQQQIIKSNTINDKIE